MARPPSRPRENNCGIAARCLDVLRAQSFVAIGRAHEPNPLLVVRLMHATPHGMTIGVQGELTCQSLACRCWFSVTNGLACNRADGPYLRVGARGMRRSRSPNFSARCATGSRRTRQARCASAYHAARIRPQQRFAGPGAFANLRCLFIGLYDMISLAHEINALYRQDTISAHR